MHESGELEGLVTAFGAAVGRCFVAVFATREKGPRAHDAVAIRLVLVVEKLLPRVVVLNVGDLESLYED
jgi:hypothetical protein